MTEELKVELPELPEPDGTVEIVEGTDAATGGSIVKFDPAWSAERVRAYALQAVKEERERLFTLAESKGWGMKNDDPFEDCIRELWREMDRRGKQPA